MKTAIESGLHGVVRRTCRPGTPWGRFVADVADRMNGGYYEPGLLHLFVHNREGRYDRAEALGFTLFLKDFFTGVLAHTRVRVYPDLDAPGGFGASEPFFMEPEGRFPRFGWRVPVGLELNIDEGPGDGVRHEFVEVAPRTVPLVIGYTTAGRTLANLQRRGGFASWRPGGEWATVVFKTPKGAPRGPAGFKTWPNQRPCAG